LLEFDEVSAYRDQITGDSVNLMLTNGVGANAFKFTTFDKNTLVKV